jgi:hypothetical protein
MGSTPLRPPSVLNEGHLIAFGGIISTFARFEHALVLALAHVSGLPPHKLILISQGLSYRAKLDTLYSYMEVSDQNPTLKGSIKGFFDEADKYSGLRNSIAHSIWKAGTRPGSIKPMSIKVRWGKGKIYGIDDSELDYTATDLAEIWDKLGVLYNSYVSFALDHGMVEIGDE